MKWWLLTCLVLLGACRKEEVPRAVPVRLDGALELQLCSFNIRYEGDQDRGWKAWPNRLDRVLSAVRKIDPDVMGVQEALHGQVADLWASLPDYRFYGVGRDDGKRAGEYAGIFWKRDRFESDESGTFWLSDHPDVAGTKTWGNSVVRCTSWVHLVDRSTGRGFYVYNTHFDHRHQGSRERAAVLIAERIDQRTKKDDPVVLLGDFNAVENNAAVAYFRGKGVTLSGKAVAGWSGRLIDPYDDRNRQTKNRRTLHFWSADRTGWAKVDHILVSQGAEALDAGIFAAETQRTQPSDHFPVWARVSWPASTASGNAATLLPE